MCFPNSVSERKFSDLALRIKRLLHNLVRTRRAIFFGLYSFFHSLKDVVNFREQRLTLKVKARHAS